ncbi:MAG: hypothetical protein DCC58_12565 [Chloroflexi bacterium]|nr:MAG: hypothetical protein DCC58_12565 [Chloroflexota bacterium]
MENLVTSTSTEDAEQRRIPVIRTKGLLAEYTTGTRPSGEWFALGTVRSDDETFARPAWLIVGTGQSQEAAVASLFDRLEREAARLSAA